MSLCLIVSSFYLIYVYKMEIKESIIDNRARECMQTNDDYMRFLLIGLENMFFSLVLLLLHMLLLIICYLSTNID